MTIHDAALSYAELLETSAYTATERWLESLASDEQRELRELLELCAYYKASMRLTFYGQSLEIWTVLDGPQSGHTLPLLSDFANGLRIYAQQELAQGRDPSERGAE